jgi:hypothetical protein
MNLHKKNRKNKGYVLIEVLVAYSIFVACAVLYGHVMGTIVRVHRAMHGHLHALVEQSAQCERQAHGHHATLTFKPVIVPISGTDGATVQGVVFDE